jgi:hypothetical protein
VKKAKIANFSIVVDFLLKEHAWENHVQKINKKPWQADKYSRLCCKPSIDYILARNFASRKKTTM